MTDTPNPPGDDPTGGPDPTGAPEPVSAAAGVAATPWYRQPATWIVAAAAVLVVVVLIIVLSGDDDDDTTVEDDDGLTSEPTETDPPEATDPPATDPPATDPPATDPPATDPPEATDPPATLPPATDPPDPGPEPVVVEASPVNATLEQADYLALPWADDVEVTAHWYTWEGNFVAVYAGWEASEDAPLCPGNSLQDPDGEFAFISNSPSHNGGCDPEDAFSTLVPEDDDDPSGARVCGSLVLYRTIIPTTGDDGAPTPGVLYGSVEQAVDEGYNGATSAVPIADGIAELDPTADAYAVPEGWLPGGETEVVC